MSLNQLTENYTDSDENEERDERIKNISISEDDEDIRKVSAKNTPSTPESKDSRNHTPKKRGGALVSYGNDDDEDPSYYKIEDSDENLHSEPMDTGTDDNDEDKPANDVNLGVKLPTAPPGKCTRELQEKVSHFVNKAKHGTDYNRKIQNNKAFRNPSIYEKLIEHLGLDERGSNYPLHMFDPHCWGKESFYDELSKVQKEEMDRREKERKEKTKVDIITGTKKAAEEEAKKRKSRFDQGVPGASGNVKPSVPPPTLTTVPTGNKPTISAFGSLKKV